MMKHKLLYTDEVYFANDKGLQINNVIDLYKASKEYNNICEKSITRIREDVEYSKMCDKIVHISSISNVCMMGELRNYTNSVF